MRGVLAEDTFAATLAPGLEQNPLTCAHRLARPNLYEEVKAVKRGKAVRATAGNIGNLSLSAILKCTKQTGRQSRPMQMQTAQGLTRNQRGKHSIPEALRSGAS